MPAFFRLFPPPKLLLMPYTGLDISDDALSCLEYHLGSRGLSISKYAHEPLPAGLIEGGDIKDEVKFASILKDFAAKNRITFAKVSLPEEKAYLFQSDVPDADPVSIAQNIEFKLEENVPLAASDTVFYFDLIPPSEREPSLRASVSVVPRTYAEHYIAMLRDAGISPTAFEVAPKSIAKAVTDPRAGETELIVHAMKRKTGLYISSGGIVRFTSTIGGGEIPDVATIRTEIGRVYSYWTSRDVMEPPISRIIAVGERAALVEDGLARQRVEDLSEVALADVWRNSLDLETYVPPIPRAESFGYAAAAGLAMPAIPSTGT